MAKAASIDVIHVTSPDELRVAFNGPAVLANKVFVTPTTAGARIAFIEKSSAEAGEFRAAVVLPYDQVEALVEILKKMLGEYVRKIEVPAMLGSEPAKGKE